MGFNLTQINLACFCFVSNPTDHIAIQDYIGGAMENWGLITYQDVFLLYGMSDLVRETSYSSIITHELAHQVSNSCLNVFGVQRLEVRLTQAIKARLPPTCSLPQGVRVH